MVNIITEAKKFHYIYKLTNLNPQSEEKYYIGVHSSDKEPVKDGYMSSSKYIKQAIKSGEKFKKEILSSWNTRDEAQDEEIRLHEDLNASTNPEYYNRYDANSSDFTTFGKVVVFNTLTNEQTIVSKEEFDKCDYLISPNKGTMIVYDKIEGKYTQVTKEEFSKNDRYDGSLKNKVIVNDTRDNSRKLVSKEDFDKYDYYIGALSNTVVVIDSRDGNQKRVSREDFKNHDYYKSIIKNKVNVVDLRTGKNTQVSKEDFDKHDYYESCNKQKPIAVYDPISKMNILVSKEEFEKGNYKHVNKGMVTVKDTRTGKTMNVSKEDFNKYDYYVQATCKTFRIYDKQGELVHTITSGFASFCKEHGLPKAALESSYLSNGTPIYPNPTVVLYRNGNIKYQGWYAIKEDA